MARLARFIRPVPTLHPAAADQHQRAAKNTWPEPHAADSFIKGGHDVAAFEPSQPVGPTGGSHSLTNPAHRRHGVVARGARKRETELEMCSMPRTRNARPLRLSIAVRNAPTKINANLMWSGAPNDFDYPSLTGTVTLHTGAGQFTKIDPGIGKLLGVLSLQSLPRRITLDFKDIFSEGFAFDDIDGEFKIQKGLMHTESLKLEGPAAQVTLTGDIDLAKETQRLDVRVKPALSSTFSAALRCCSRQRSSARLSERARCSRRSCSTIRSTRSSATTTA